MYVVFLHGPPASGKKTVGDELRRASGLPLFHNHLVVDIVLRFFEFGSPGFVSLRRRLWVATFEEAVARERSFIFTFHPEATVEPDTVGALCAVVEEAGGSVLFVELRCSEDEIERRLDSPSRREFDKLRSVALYRRLRDDGAFDFPPLPPPWLRIDTGSSPAAAAAKQVLGRLQGSGLAVPLDG